MKKTVIVLTGLILLAATGARADAFFDQFNKDYNTLSQDLLNNTGEVAEISDFVYQKDVATITFTKGKIHFQRYVNGRPTTAIYIGTGHVHIDVPTHAGRQGLWAVAKDSVVDEDFEFLFIRMADDFDLALKEKFTFEQENLDWRQMAKAKEEQGEFYFLPRIQHPYDNYFRLLISCYERAADGFFWCDFDRYVFTYDPNWPEQVNVAYEFEPADMVVTTGARFQRKENNHYADSLLSDIPYPTTILKKTAAVDLSGQDGRRLESGQCTLDLLVNADSLRYTWFYLQFNLELDSVKLGDTPVDFMRRKSFEYTGVILPQYFHAGDTLHLTAFYHGRNYDHFLPSVSNPAACPQEVTFTVPKGYAYYTSGMGPMEETDDGKMRFTATSPAPFTDFFYQCYATGVEDTLPKVSDLGLTLNFVIADRDIRRKSCFINRETYQTSIMAAFNYLSSRFGGPPFVFSEYVIPTGFQSMPGMIKVPQQACVTEGIWQNYGGFDAISGNGVARQWFGTMMRPRSDRDGWVHEALPAYMGLLFIQNDKSSQHYFDNLFGRRDSLYKNLDIGQDLPLSAGTRLTAFADENGLVDNYAAIRTNRGIWLMHMLRFVMYDVESGSETAFNGFLRELFLTVNNKTFTNADIRRLAEKHYGQDLGWFFEQWMYGVFIPKFDVTWTVASRDGKYYLPVTVKTEDVTPGFRMPVIVRVVDGDGQYKFYRKPLEGMSTKFELGPFDKAPQDFVFNEFMSILSRDNVSKK